VSVDEIEVYGFDTINNDLRIVPIKKNQRGERTNGTAQYTVSETDGVVSLPFHYALSKNFSSTRDENIDIKYLTTLRDYQVEPINKAFELLQRTSCAFLDLRAGFGKTVISAKISVMVGLRVFVLIKSKNLISQWKNTFLKHTTATVYVFETNKPNAYKGEDVVIVMAGRVSKMPENIKMRVGLLIVDEADTFLCKTGISSILSFTPEKVLYQTATPEREDMMHLAFDSLVGTEKVWVARNKPFTYYCFSTNIKITREFDSSGNVIWAEVVKQISENEERNNMIVDYAFKMHISKTLILSRGIDHSILLSDLCAKRYEAIHNKKDHSDYIAGNKSKFRDCPFYAGTISKIGRGFDLSSQLGEGTKDIDHVIIVHSIASKNPIEQVFGRGTRCENPRITMFVDIDKAINRHSKTVIDWCNSNGCKSIVYLTPSTY